MARRFPELDEVAVGELRDWILNEGESSDAFLWTEHPYRHKIRANLYRMRDGIENQLAKKMAKGAYDPTKAAKAWLYWVDVGAEAYVNENSPGSGGKHGKDMFPALERRQVAKEVEEYLRQEVEARAAKIQLPQKKKAKSGSRARKSSIRWPLVSEVRAELQSLFREFRGSGESELEVRLQVTDGGFNVWFGDPGFDTDHHGYWGSAMLPLDEEADVSAIAQELIDQAKEQAAQ